MIKISFFFELSLKELFLFFKTSFSKPVLPSTERFVICFFSTPSEYKFFFFEKMSREKYIEEDSFFYGAIKILNRTKQHSGALLFKQSSFLDPRHLFLSTRVSEQVKKRCALFFSKEQSSFFVKRLKKF